MKVAVENPDQQAGIDDLTALDGLFPASVTITRTSEEDFKSRQLVVSVDGESVATLMWGDSVTWELEPGSHRVRVHNTLVWKTAEFTLRPGQQVFFDAINRAGVGTYMMLMVLGAGPLYVTLRRMH
jgi:hypothetical protein